MSYCQCSKCGALMQYFEAETIHITNETFLFWCKDCLTKHLNSRGNKE